ncbi:ribosome maturation factor RimP [Clostridium cavendishii DSM 21758]|uniref:Ribosome maturation factor RimP n=1 Tax=Clostridium cavendishii DSM 21758 TaxID=1121302 RepID=A0A1M6RLY0_9CLOT|nr:ribosome maturation factor RimP [Clostridium cavendishii]SHK33358.1 ribosome maturation factor RimP [Clostridium cavendishii DSM 21758]
MNKEALIEQIKVLAKPIVEGLNYELYHIEYVKENDEYYLRIYIDKPDRISLKDCETVSRQISDMLDTEDPIKDPYYLEISSPGLNRGLYTEKHYKRFVGSLVLIKLTKSLEGKKSITGILEAVNEDSLIIKEQETELEICVPKDKIKTVNLEGEI